MDIDVTILCQLGLFLLTLVVVTNILLKPVMHVIEARVQRIEGAEREATRFEKLASESRDAYLTRIHEARALARREREALRTAGNDVKRDLLVEVRAEIAKTLHDTRERVGVSELEVHQSLFTETDALARRLVSRLIGREV